MKTTSLKLMIAACVIMSPCRAGALEKAFPASVKVADKELSLNGVGLRETEYLGVDVYYAGLYLESRSSDAQSIIKSSGPKQLRLYFMREVSKDELRSACDDGFRKNRIRSPDLLKKLRTLKSSLGSMRKGQMLKLTFADDSITVIVNGKRKGTIQSAEFCKAVLSIWIGKNPPSSDLKKGMLGWIKR